LPVLEGCAAAGGLVLAVGRVGRFTGAGRVDFFELVRFSEVFFDDFAAGAFLPEADLFLVTFFPISFRLDEDLPDCLALLPTAFRFADCAPGRLDELPFDDRFEVVFLEAAFFFGIS
jgi:hypothetical protein